MNTRRNVQSNLHTAQRGFTLIELIMVIVILGILAAVAVPKFIDISDDAKIAAGKTMVGSLREFCSTNAALKAANSVRAVDLSSATMDNIMDTSGINNKGWTVSGLQLGSDSITLTSGGTPEQVSITIIPGADNFSCTVSVSGSSTTDLTVSPYNW